MMYFWLLLVVREWHSTAFLLSLTKLSAVSLLASSVFLIMLCLLLNVSVEGALQGYTLVTPLCHVTRSPAFYHLQTLPRFLLTNIHLSSVERQ